LVLTCLKHFETQSIFAEQMLNHWHTEVGKFWQVVPLEMIERYEQPVHPPTGTGADMERSA